MEKCHNLFKITIILAMKMFLLSSFLYRIYYQFVLENVENSIQNSIVSVYIENVFNFYWKIEFLQSFLWIAL